MCILFFENCAAYGAVILLYCLKKIVLVNVSFNLNGSVSANAAVH